MKGIKGFVSSLVLAFFVTVQGSHITGHVDYADATCPTDYLGRATGEIRYWDWTFDEFNKPLEVVDKDNRLNFDLELQYYHYTGPGVSFWEAWEGCNDLGRPFNNETKLPMEKWQPLYELAQVTDLEMEDCIFREDKNNLLKYLRRPKYPIWLAGMRDPESPNKMKWVTTEGTTDYFFKKTEFLYRLQKSEWTDIEWDNMAGKELITDEGKYYNWFLDEPRAYHAGQDDVYDDLAGEVGDAEATMSDPFPVDFPHPIFSHVEYHHRDCLAVSNGIRKNQSFKWVTADCYAKFKYICKPRQAAIQAYLSSYYGASGVFADEPHFNSGNAPEYSKDFLKHWACEGLKGDTTVLTLSYRKLDNLGNQIAGTMSTLTNSDPEWINSDLSWVGIACDEGDGRKK